MFCAPLNNKKICLENGLSYHLTGIDFQTMLEEYAKDLAGHPIKMFKANKRLTIDGITKQFNDLMNVADKYDF